MGKENYDAI